MDGFQIRFAEKSALFDLVTKNRGHSTKDQAERIVTVVFTSLYFEGESCILSASP